jgi:hypothetical protein
MPDTRSSRCEVKARDEWCRKNVARKDSAEMAKDDELAVFTE